MNWMQRYAAGVVDTYVVESVEPFDSDTVFSHVAAGAIDRGRSLQFLEYWATELLGGRPGQYFVGLSYDLGPVTDGDMTMVTISADLHSQDGEVDDALIERFRESVDLAVLRGATAKVVK